MSFAESGFGAHVSNTYTRRMDVFNRGFSGYNTRWAKHYLPEIFPASTKADLFVVFFGANDASLVDLNPRQHVPLDEFGSNLIDMCNYLKDMCKGQILLVTPPPVDHEQRLVYQVERYGKQEATGKLERTNCNAGKYASKCVEIGHATQIPVLDLWTAMQSESNWASLLSDGLHLSPAGNRFVGRAMVHSIQQHYPDLAVAPNPVGGSLHNSGSASKILPLLPWHDEIDATSYVEYQALMAVGSSKC